MMLLRYGFVIQQCPGEGVTSQALSYSDYTLL